MEGNSIGEQCVDLDGKPFILEERDPNAEKVGDDEIRRLMAEVDEARKNLPADDDDLPTLEEAIAESIEYYRSIPMYDFGLGKMSNEQDIGDFYGLDTVRRIKQEIEESYGLPNNVREAGRVSRKLWQEMRDTRAGRKPPQKSVKKKKKSQQIEITQRQRQPGDDYFIPIERGIIRNRSYREVFDGPRTVYDFIWSNLVRSNWQDTNGYPIKKKYYDNGYLACTMSYRYIARECGQHKNKVQGYIDRFREAGIVIVDDLVREGKKRAQSVFILGTWKSVKDKDGTKNIVEHYFLNDVFITRKDGQNVPN